VRSPHYTQAAPSIQICPDPPIHESTVCEGRASTAHVPFSGTSRRPAQAGLQLQAGDELGVAVAALTRRGVRPRATTAPLASPEARKAGVDPVDW
jgi:hypothetical protein